MGLDQPRLPAKDAWLDLYARRILGTWRCGQAPVQPASAYADQIRRDLSEYYNEPLKRAFIETTYRPLRPGRPV